MTEVVASLTFLHFDRQKHLDMQYCDYCQVVTKASELDNRMHVHLLLYAMTAQRGKLSATHGSNDCVRYDHVESRESNIMPRGGLTREPERVSATSSRND